MQASGTLSDQRIGISPSRHPSRAWRVPPCEQAKIVEFTDEMTEVTVDLPEEVAEAIEQRAAALGTTADHWLSMVIADVVADVPEEGDGPDDWICR